MIDQRLWNYFDGVDLVPLLYDAGAASEQECERFRAALVVADSEEAKQAAIDAYTEASHSAVNAILRAEVASWVPRATEALRRLGCDVEHYLARGRIDSRALQSIGRLVGIAEPEIRTVKPSTVVYRLLDLDANTHRNGGRAETVVTVATPTNTPKKWLMSWAEMSESVGQPNDGRFRRLVRSMHGKHGGPVTMPKQGGQPKVDKAVFLEWWDSLEQLWAEVNQRQEDARATVAPSYRHGRSATVIPEIGGHEHHRRNVKPPKRSENI